MLNLVFLDTGTHMPALLMFLTGMAHEFIMLSMQPSTAVSGTNQKPAPRKSIMLIIALMVGSVGAFMTSALNVALQAINQEFEPSAIVLNWVVTSFILSMAVFSIPSGRIADILGLKRITIIGTVIFLAGTVIAIFSNSITLLIICRTIQGVGSAMIGATIVAMLTMTFPAKERGRALGIYISSIYAWLAAGPFLGGLLTEYFNWRSLFIFAIPFSLAILVLLIMKVKGEWAESRGERFDYTGSIIFGLALIALIYGFSQIRDIFGIILTAAGLLGVYLFLYWENRSQSPILDVRSFRHNKAFIYSNLASLITYSATFATSYFISLYLQLVKGYNADQAGFILIAQPLIQTLVSPFTGRLSDKVEPRKVASLGMALIFIGLVSFITLSENTSLAQVIITLLVLGVGYGLFVPPNTNAIMSSVTPKYYAVASSVTGTMRNIGQTLSMGITLIVTAIVIGNIAMTPENHTGFLPSSKITFVIFAALCLSGIFASLARGSQGVNTEEKASQKGPPVR